MSIHSACKKMLCAGLMLLIVGTAGAQSRNLKNLPIAGRAGELAQEMLEIHNAFRTDVNLPPLQWSSRLAEYSQAWANTLIANNLSMHNPNSPYGENIFISGPGSTPSEVVEKWASELTDYSYQTNSCKSVCGHYTQLVWRDTLKVGCAVARNEHREIWVCSYDPPGNYRGEWPY
jgi:pathogenesis-related protein 1